MPELPEVETTRRSIEPALLNRRISDVFVGRDRLLRRQPIPADFPGRVRGATATKVGRLGKFIMISLSNDMTLVVHLGMSGKMQIRDTGANHEKHTQLSLSTDVGQDVRLVDPRTFGFFVALDPDEMDEIILPTLGRDGFTDLPSSKELLALFGRSVSPIKALLLDQSKIAGVGNIYADEALFRARIHPESPGDTLTLDQMKELRKAVKATFTEALKWGGSSLDDLAYLLPDGRTGDFTKRLAAYGRTDEPCIRCRTPIKHIVLRQRSTHFCPTCQS
jgi:formamidopyrimidine-DNA glycosylase